MSRNLHTINSNTIEGAIQSLKDIFSAKVIFVNHEKRLDVDTVLSNLAIKYNMLYLSVYQLIKQHIRENSEIGKFLLKNKKAKVLNDSARLLDGGDDETEL